MGELLLMFERFRDATRRRMTGWYLARTLGKSGKDCNFGHRLRIYGKPQISLGDRVIVNDGVTLQSCDGTSITIGNRVVLSYDCMVLTGGLERELDGSTGHVTGPVVIEDDVWLGARCIVLPGVTIGRRSVIAAGAVVTKSLPPDSLAAGVPARVLRQTTRTSVHD